MVTGQFCFAAMALVFSIINNKGGTGKTTTALNLGAALSLMGKRVLLIDFDSQCNLSSAFGVDASGHHGKPEMLSVGDVLLGRCQIRDAIVPVGAMSLLPSTDRLLDVEFQLNNEPGREYVLKEQVDRIDSEYDFVLIDCPPSLSTLSTNSLVAAQYFIVPMQAENFAFIGLDRIMLTSEKVKKRMNPLLELSGILFVKLVHRTKFSQAVITNLSTNRDFEGKMFNTFIRQDIALMESAAFNQTVFEYAPDSRGAEDYKEFANELVRKHGQG